MWEGPRELLVASPGCFLSCLGLVAYKDITELGSPKHSQGLGQVKERGQQPRPRTELRMAGTLHMTCWAQAWHVGHPQDIEPLETLQVWFSG